MKTKILVLVVLLVSQNINAQWEWQNPLPQGENLFTIITLSPSRAIVSGNGGTIMTTHDYGEKWHIQKLPGVGWVRRYSVISEDEAYLVGDTKTLFRTTDGGITWQSLSISLDVDYSVYGIQHVEFIDNKTGYILLNPPHTWTAEAQAPYPGLMYKTNDAGVSWEKVDVGINRKFNQLVFIDSLKGFLLSQPRSIPGQDYYYSNVSFLHMTSDGGNSWLTLPDTGYGLINFINDQVGWAGTYKTTDGGLSWEKKQFNFPDSRTDIEALYFVDESSGYAILYDTILKTNDEGNSWIDIKTLQDVVLEDIKFFSTQNGYFCGFGGILYRTSDNGQTWNRFGKGVTSRLQNIEFKDDDTGWVTGANGTVLFTNNGGENWVEQNLPDECNETSFNGIHFLNENNVWIVGGNYVLKTKNLGENWNILFKNDLTEESFYDIEFINNENGFIVGIKNWYTGLLYKTTNGGISWQRKDEGNLPKLNQIFFIDSEYGWICGAGICLRTTDGGDTWQSKYFNEDLRYIQFSDRDHGWMTAQDELAFYRTTNGGMDWILVPDENRAYEGFSTFFFFDNERGVASTVLFSDIFITIDGGLHWTKKDRLPLSIKRIIFVNDELGWAVGDGGRILVKKDSYFVSNNIETSNNSDAPSNTIISYPNPFNNRTNIVFYLNTPKKILVSVYNIFGELVENIHSINGVEGMNKMQWEPSNIGSGIYLIKISGNRFTKVMKCLYLK